MIIVYIEVVMISLGLLFIGLLVTSDFSIPILERLSLITFNLLMMKPVVEYFTLKYFDRRM